jgi:hypothetical protein
MGLTKQSVYGILICYNLSYFDWCLREALAQGFRPFYAKGLLNTQFERFFVTCSLQFTL